MKTYQITSYTLRELKEHRPSVFNELYQKSLQPYHPDNTFYQSLLEFLDSFDAGVTTVNGKCKVAFNEIFFTKHQVSIHHSMVSGDYLPDYFKEFFHKETWWEKYEYASTCSEVEFVLYEPFVRYFKNEQTENISLQTLLIQSFNRLISFLGTYRWYQTEEEFIEIAEKDDEYGECFEFYSNGERFGSLLMNEVAVLVEDKEYFAATASKNHRSELPIALG